MPSTVDSGDGVRRYVAPWRNNSETRAAAGLRTAAPRRSPVGCTPAWPLAAPTDALCWTQNAAGLSSCATTNEATNQRHTGCHSGDIRRYRWQVTTPNSTLRAVRMGMLMSQDDFARALRVAGERAGAPNDANKRLVQRWEAGTTVAPMPASSANPSE